MPRFMLDTDTISYALRGQGAVREHLVRYQPSDVCASAISLAELNFGAERSRSRRIRKAIKDIVEDLAIVPFDQAAADQFGVVAATLERRGSPIGNYDTLIAAHALALGVTLVTNNTRHFRKVPGLTVENWA